jgi:hypothetical protein
MKASIKTIVLILLLGNIKSIGQVNEQYFKAMQKNVAILDTASKRETYQTILHSFERISKVEKIQWLPNYYIALCASSLASQTRNNNIAEELTDKAEAYLAIADSLSPNNSEIYVLKAQIAFTKIKVDVMERGLKNTMAANQFLSNALKLDSENPRAYFLIGMGKYSMPEQVGGNKKQACEYFQKAEELLKKRPQNDIYPHWGADDVSHLLNKCNKAASTVTPNSGK